MSTVRLNKAQKRKVREATAFLERQRGRRVTQGEAIEDALDYALRNKLEWLEGSGKAVVPLSQDPFFDRRIKFEMGKTDSSNLDALIYGGD
jgi:hypothetical protein